MTTTRHLVSVAAVVVAIEALALGVATLVVGVAGNLFPSIRGAQCPLFLYVCFSTSNLPETTAWPGFVCRHSPCQPLEIPVCLFDTPSLLGQSHQLAQLWTTVRINLCSTCRLDQHVLYPVYLTLDITCLQHLSFCFLQCFNCLHNGRKQCFL